MSGTLLTDHCTGIKRLPNKELRCVPLLDAVQLVSWACQKSVPQEYRCRTTSLAPSAGMACVHTHHITFVLLCCMTRRLRQPRGRHQIRFSSIHSRFTLSGHVLLQMLMGKPIYVALAQRREVRRTQLEAQFAQRTGMPPRGLPMAGQGMYGMPYWMGAQPGMPQQPRCLLAPCFLLWQQRLLPDMPDSVKEQGEGGVFALASSDLYNLVLVGSGGGVVHMPQCQNQYFILASQGNRQLTSSPLTLGCTMPNLLTQAVQHDAADDASRAAWAYACLRRPRQLPNACVCCRWTGERLFCAQGIHQLGCTKYSCRCSVGQVHVNLV